MHILNKHTVRNQLYVGITDNQYCIIKILNDFYA